MQDLHQNTGQARKDFDRLKKRLESVDTPRQKVSLRGALKGAKFSDREIEEAKRSMSSSFAAE